MVQNPINRDVLVNTYSRGQAHGYEEDRYLMVRKSTDRGLTYGDESIAYDPGGTLAVMSPGAGYVGAVLHVLFTVIDSDDSCALFHIQSTDDGDTWGTPDDITSVVADVSMPVFRNQNPLIYNDSVLMGCFYRNAANYDDIEVMCLRYSASTWTAVSVYVGGNGSVTDYENEGAIIALSDSDLLMLVRHESKETQIQYYSDDNGDTWTKLGEQLYNLDRPTLAQPVSLSSFYYDQNEVIVCYLPRHYEDSKPLKAIYGTAQDLIDFGLYGWNELSVKTICDYHTEVVKYGGNVHYHNDFNARGVWSRLDTNAGATSQLMNIEVSSQSFSSLTGKLFPSIGTSDADANAYISAISETDNDIKTAIYRFVYEMKLCGAWTKCKAIYPIIGGTEAKHKFNLKTPTDADASFRLTFVDGAGVGWAHAATGATPDGTGSYARTYFIPDDELTLYSAHLSYYSQTEVDEVATDIGGYDSVDAKKPALSLTTFSNNIATFYAYMASSITDSVSAGNLTTSKGYVIGTRVSNVENNLYKDAILEATDTDTAHTAQLSKEVYLGASNADGTASSFSTKTCVFASAGDGLTKAEAVGMSYAVHRLQSALGRGHNS